MYIRKATVDDMDTISRIETLTFPAPEAASAETFLYRLHNFPEYFFAALSDDGKITAFLSGRPVSTNKNSGITDEMYENNEFPSGDTFALLSVNTLPEFQKNGYASALIKHAADNAKKLKLKRIILACKEEKLSFYSKFGFTLMGLSCSNHGGAVWYDMYMDL